jgi:hypothetical protein
MLEKSISSPMELAELGRTRKNGDFLGFFLGRLWFWLEIWPILPVP